jgi:DNA mismatch repair protein MutS2
MDAKTLHTLEYPKVLSRLAGYCAFAASIDKAQSLQPTNNIDEARRRLAETSEAVQMLVTRPDLTIGGARDVRQPVDLAAHGGVLAPTDLLDIKSTLIAATTWCGPSSAWVGSIPPSLK